jgi:phenylalanyl-tRNA synthetase beta chain
MKVLYSWLKEYVDIDLQPKELETKLFSVGFEVEGMEYLGENLDKVVVGQITSMEKYEGTHLQICHVNCGPMGEDHLILTGADNVFVGAKVPAALVGAKLPCGLDIQPRKMVDMMSYGMLCSGEEMNLNKDWYPGADVNGIMILSEDAPLGMEMRDYLELDDYLFDISITANRPDCQSVIGIAKEVAAFLKKLRPAGVTISKTSSPV